MLQYALCIWQISYWLKTIALKAEAIDTIQVRIECRFKLYVSFRPLLQTITSFLSFILGDYLII